MLVSSVGSNELGEDEVELLGLGDLDALVNEVVAQSLLLVLVSNADQEASNVGVGDLADTGSGGNGLADLSNEGDLSVVVDEARGNESAVASSLLDGEIGSEEVLDGLLGEGLLEGLHGGDIGRTNGANLELVGLAGELAHVLVRIAADGGVRELLSRGAGLVEDDTGIESNDVVRGDEHGVDIELLDPVDIGDELGEADEDLVEELLVAALLATDTLEGLVDLGLLHASAGLLGVDGRNGHGGVLVDLDEGTTGTEDEDGTDLGVVAAAEDDLVTVGEVEHELDGDALEGIGLADLLEVALDGVEGLLDLLSVSEVELDTTDIGLVGDGLGVELDDDGVAHGVGELGGLLGGLSEEGLDGGDAVGLEEGLGLGLGEEVSAGGDDTLDDLEGLLLVDLAGGLGGDLIEGLEVGGVLPHVVEDLGGGIGVGEGGDAGVSEDLSTLVEEAATHPGSEDGLAGNVGVLGEGDGGLGGLGDGLGGQDDKHTIGVGIVSSDLEGVGVGLGRSITENIDGVVVGPGGGEEGVVGGHGLVGDLGEGTSTHDELIGADDTGTTGVGDDGEAVAGGLGLLVEDISHVEELLDGVDTDDAGTLEGGGEDVIGAGEGTGVGGGGLGGGGGAAGLDDDDGLAEGDLTGGGEEGTGVTDGLHVDEDGVGVLIVAEVVDEVGEVDVGHGTDGDEGGVAETLLEGPVEDGAHEGAGLGDETDVTLEGHGGGEGGVEAGGRAHEAEAVGADASHVVLLALSDDVVLHLGTLGSDLLETSGDDDEGTDASLTALDDGAEDELGGDADDGEVDVLGNVADLLVGLETHDLVLLGVDGNDLSAEGGVGEVLEDGLADGADSVGGTDEGDGVGVEDGIEIVGAGDLESVLILRTGDIPDNRILALHYRRCVW